MFYRLGKSNAKHERQIGHKIILEIMRILISIRTVYTVQVILNKAMMKWSVLLYGKEEKVQMQMLNEFNL